MPSYIVVVGRFTNRVALTNSPPGTSYLRTGVWCSGATGRASLYGSMRTHATQDEAVAAFKAFMMERVEVAIEDMRGVARVWDAEMERFDDDY